MWIFDCGLLIGGKVRRAYDVSSSVGEPVEPCRNIETHRGAFPLRAGRWGTAMLMEIYPKPDGMQHVNFLFCADRPDPEDDGIRVRLDALPIPPKRSFEETRRGRTYTALQYGQCVIGHSLYAIEKYKAVVDAVAAAYTDAPALDGNAGNKLIARLAEELEPQARFTVDEVGKLTIAFSGVDAAGIRQRFCALLRKT